MKLIIIEDFSSELQLSRNELLVLERAQAICEKADKLIRPGGDSDADPTIYAYASGDLGEIISEAKGD